MSAFTGGKNRNSNGFKQHAVFFDNDILCVFGLFFVFILK